MKSSNTTLEQNRVFDEEMYRIAMNYQLQKKCEKEYEIEELYRRIEKLEYQVSMLLSYTNCVNQIPI